MVHHPHHPNKTERGINKFFKTVSHSPIVKELGRDATAMASVPKNTINAMNKVTTAGADSISSNMNLLLYIAVGVGVYMFVNKSR
jgi:hypothetical protein